MNQGQNSSSVGDLFIFLNNMLIIFRNSVRRMEALLFKLESLPAYKDSLKAWCRQNNIKVSFMVNITLSKSKSIYSKLLKTYSKNFSSFKFRWLENELKLFHFSLLTISTISQIKINEFGEREYTLLKEAFPHKNQCLLQYETMNFITKKDVLKKKWEAEEDHNLTEIVHSQQESLKWNQIAVQLFLKSDKRFFRTSKQCRERWLNHLDSSIKHQKWSEEEDKKLIQNVILEGKKWSQIMRAFENARTEHMIKNRFISLLLKFKKLYPLIQDEDELVKKIAMDLGIDLSPEKQAEREEIEKKLRPKVNKTQNQQSEKKPKIQQIEENQPQMNFPISQRSSFQPLQHSNQNGNLLSFDNNMIQTIPTPNLISPLAYMECNSFANNFAYFQYYLNCIQREQ